jgi:hypothetical protein
MLKVSSGATDSEIRLISQTPRLGGMMISEVSDGKAKFYEGVQGRGRSVGA